jgi:glycerol-3-phosphate dehydrogenase
VSRKLWSVPVTVQKAAAGRSGDWAEKIAMDHPMDRSLVCECEEVSVGEAEMAIRDLDVHNLTDLRRRTRVGMGTCQAELCACRAAGLLVKAHGCADRARADLKDFMNERWKGMYPVAWGETLREGEFTQWIYKAVLGL